MSYTLAIDPGTRGNLGWAMFQGNCLIAHGRNFTFSKRWYDTIVFERPEFYRQAQSKANPNKLAKLVEQIGYIKGWMTAFNCAGQFKEYLPKEWKGQIDKDVCARRAARVLHGGDFTPAKNATLDEWDAIALGLFHLGRYNPQNTKGKSIV